MEKEKELLNIIQSQASHVSNLLRFNFPSWKKKKNEEEEAAYKQVKKVHSIQFYDCNFSGPRKVKTKNKAKISIT